MFRWLIRLRVWWSAPPCPGAEVYQVPGREEDFRHLFGAMALPPTRHDSPPMPPCKPARDADFWDVTLAAESEREENRVRYEFLGLTGLEDE